jgi:hypothetical protein
MLRIVMPVFAGIALGVACVPTLWYGYALIEQKRAFPELLTFEHVWERVTYRQVHGVKPTIVAAPRAWSSDGKVAYSVESHQYGIFLSLLPLPDWRGYSSIKFTLAAHGKGFPVAVCVRDARPNNDPHNNRYCKRVLVTALPTDFSITFDEIRSTADERPFDFSRVEAVVFSAAKPGNKNELLIDNIRLEN